MNKTKPPSGWPENVEYLCSSLRVSPGVEASVLKLLHTPNAATSQLDKISVRQCPSPNPLVRITPIVSPHHPAQGQNGLFATKHLAPSTFILPYLGCLHSEEGSDPDSDYDISLDRELGLAIDATLAGNEARMINDFRGISDRPNAEFKDIWVQLEVGKWERWCGVFVLGAGKAGKRKGGIKAGEEILTSYGRGFWKARESS